MRAQLDINLSGMNTSPSELMFLSADEAQDLLDEQDPGFYLEVCEENVTRVYNPQDMLVLVLAPEGVKI